MTNDSSGSFDSVITNENFDSFTILTVDKDNYLEIKRAKMMLVSEYFESIDPMLIGAKDDGSYQSGMYKVGVMLPAGEYKLIPEGDSAYVAVMKDSYCIGVDSIISNDNFSSEKYVTVKDGQYLMVNRATIVPVQS